MSHIPTTTLPFPELASALPPEDVVALGSLVGARQVRIWTRKRIEECKKQLDALIALNNSVSPINTLPNELLMKIFASIPIYTWSSAPWMLIMGHICQRWRAVVLTTPEFWVKPLKYWTDPENDDEQNRLIPVFLERSSPCPLQLSHFEPRSARKTRYHGWAAHFGRLTVLKAYVEGRSEVPAILRRVASKMSRLERLKLEECPGPSGDGVKSTAELDLPQWKAESLPCLKRLEISGRVFCRDTTVPSLHTLILRGPGGPESWPRLLDGLGGCPALATLRVEFGLMPVDEDSEAPAPDCVLDLPNLRRLTIGGREAAIRRFLSYISFPASAARIALHPSELPRPGERVLTSISLARFSILDLSPTIDRLFLQSGVDYRKDVPFLSMRGYVHGAERLAINPALWIHRADDFLQFLEVFGACTVTMLALDLRHVVSDMDGEFWRRFFAAFPNLRRLQLLSCNVESRETKREIAEQFLAFAQSPHQAAHAISLAWVLHADTQDASHLEKELSDVERVFGGHGQQGARLGHLEIHVTSGKPSYCRPEHDSPQLVDVKHFKLNDTTKWLLKKDYVSRLSEAAEVVTVGGQARLCTDEDNEEDEFEDEPDGDGAFEGGSDGDDASGDACVEEYEVEEASSSSDSDTD